MSAGPVHYSSHRNPTVTLTVTVSPSSGAIAPDGTVELFYNGSVPAIANVQIVNGVAKATFDLQFYARGSYDRPRPPSNLRSPALDRKRF